MSVATRMAPATLGLGTLVVVGAALEALIRGGAINRYIVPLPSQVLLAFERIVVEENVVHRFLLTTAETLVAGALITIVGVEFLINFGGLGQLINELAERYDLPGTYAAIGFVVLVSVLFFYVTERIERWLRPA